MRSSTRAIWFFLAVFPAAPGAAFRYFDPDDSAAIPLTLSSTGFFSDMAGKTPVPEAVAFGINAALWSDGAWKQRWLLLPPGRSIPYVDTADFLAFPDSTVFVKNFWLEAREGDTTSRILWETRLLMKRSGPEGENRWRGFSYRWNASRNEAYLVPPEAEFDTLFRYTDTRGRRTYKRWRFPSASCTVCHKIGSVTDAAGRRTEGRAVLGFYPAQLKRPSEANGGNQVLDFFSRGVFSGSEPDSAALAKRFIGIKEPIDPAGSAEERWRMLDIQARSYLAANCSGCHGYRGIAIGAIGEIRVNFDFYRLSPAIPFAHFPTQTFSLNDTTRFLPNQDPYGRGAFIEAVAMAGLDTNAGRPWNMGLPPYSGDPRQSVVPALLYPGYPAVTELLYRQARRASAWLDSAKLFRHYSTLSMGGDTAAAGKLIWLFGAPWGSSAWEDTLAQHGWSPDSVFAATGQFLNGQYSWYRAPEQMPELGSYLPDTAALDILAEWVRGYPAAAGIRGRPYGGADAGEYAPPRLVGRILMIPGQRTGPAYLTDLRGRLRDLIRVGPGVFRLPDSLRPGIYVFHGGRCSCRIKVP